MRIRTEPRRAQAPDSPVPEVVDVAAFRRPLPLLVAGNQLAPRDGLHLRPSQFSPGTMPTEHRPVQSQRDGGVRRRWPAGRHSLPPPPGDLSG